MISIKDVIMNREQNISASTKLETFREDVRKILRTPLRAHLKITKKDTERLNMYLEQLSFGQVRSLREFLRVVPAVTEQRVSMSFDKDNNFGTTNLNHNHPNVNILKEKYDNHSDELDISIKLQ